jgi:hypothetical protein
MKSLPLIAAMLVTVLAPHAAFAMTDAECTTAWTAADANKDGSITETEASRYFAALRVANKSVADGKLTNAAFIEHCKAGLYDTAKMDAGAPLPGANSFTEGQAKDRIAAAGFGTAADLKKDADGIWRGTAANGAKTTSVAVDYKGNVVAK